MKTIKRDYVAFADMSGTETVMDRFRHDLFIKHRAPTQRPEVLIAFPETKGRLHRVFLDNVLIGGLMGRRYRAPRVRFSTA